MNAETLIAALVAALVATAGLWWFRFVLKDAQKLPPATRYGVYALIWFAYFVLIMVLAARMGGAS